MFGCGAVLTAALVLSAPLAHGAGHGGGGHGGGGHGGGGHGGGHGGGGFHSSSFQNNSFHSNSFHNNSFHSNSFHNNSFHNNSYHNNSFHNGFHNGFHHGFHNRNNFVFGFGWPFWGGYYGGYYGGGYYPYNYSYPVYYDQPYYDYSYVPTYSAPVNYRIITQPGAMPYADGVGGGGSLQTQPGGAGYTPSPDGTYPYDGGPRNPVPMPNTDAAPPAGKSATPEGTVVSRTVAKSKYAYLAYGEGSVSVAAEKAPASIDKKTVKKTNGN